MATKFVTNGAIMAQTPSWAKWMFRIYFFTSKALLGYFAATSLFSKEVLLETTLFITLFLDPVIYGFSKMFGIEKEETPTQNL